MSLVALAEWFGKQRLVAEAGIVDEGDARYPVAVGHFTVTLYVVLPSCKVPQEVTPIHVVELVVEEELKVFQECRLYAGLLIAGIGISVLVDSGCHRNGLALHSGPVLVGACIFSVIHSRE